MHNFIKQLKLSETNKNDFIKFAKEQLNANIEHCHTVITDEQFAKTFDLLCTKKLRIRNDGHLSVFLEKEKQRYSLNVEPLADYDILRYELFFQAWCVAEWLARVPEIAQKYGYRI